MEAPSNYKGGHYDHFYNFFKQLEVNGKISQNPTFGLKRAAGAALLAIKLFLKSNKMES